MKKPQSLPKAPPMSEDIQVSKPRFTKRRRASVEIPDDDPALRAHKAAREDAFGAVHTWNGRPLKPFSISREAIFYKLRAADDAPPLSQIVHNASAFLADALRILFLCSHDPEDFEFLRGNTAAFLRAIEKWAEGDDSWKLHYAEAGERLSPAQMAPRVTRDQAPAAISLALRIFNDSEVNRADPAPNDRNDAGE